MVEGPDVGTDEGHFCNFNSGRLMPFRKGFGYRMSHGFNRSFPARNPLSATIGEYARPERPDHRMWRALLDRQQAPGFRSMDDLLLQRDARRDDHNGSFDFR